MGELGDGLHRLNFPLDAMNGEVHSKNRTGLSGEVHWALRNTPRMLFQTAKNKIQCIYLCQLDEPARIIVSCGAVRWFSGHWLSTCYILWVDSCPLDCLRSSIPPTQSSEEGQSYCSDRVLVQPRFPLDFDWWFMHRTKGVKPLADFFFGKAWKGTRTLVTLFPAVFIPTRCALTLQKCQII